MAIEAVIFDMDGVIIDSELVHKLAFQKVCAAHGMDLTLEDYKKLCIGWTDEEGFRKLIDKFNLKEVVAKDMAKKKMQEYLKLASKNMKAVPGAKKLITSLHKKFKLALTSSSSRKEICNVLNHFDIADFFDAIVSLEDVTKAKPDPEPYILTAKKLGVVPSRCVVIEDSEVGVEAAKNAGMHCIGFDNGIEGQDLSKADEIVDRLSQIPDCIEKISLKQ